jgi:uncharacterized protein YlxW (UPF0749 family)
MNPMATNMVSREFLSWLASKPIRLMAMITMVMVLTFSLIMLFGAQFHAAQVADQQIEALRRIEAEALRAKAEALKAKVQADANTRDVKKIERTIRDDH